jgi:broad specificity phosphatase PhoE
LGREGRTAEATRGREADGWGWLHEGVGDAARVRVGRGAVYIQARATRALREIELESRTPGPRHQPFLGTQHVIIDEHGLCSNMLIYYISNLSHSREQ